MDIRTMEPAVRQATIEHAESVARALPSGVVPPAAADQAAVAAHAVGRWHLQRAERVRVAGMVVLGLTMSLPLVGLVLGTALALVGLGPTLLLNALVGRRHRVQARRAGAAVRALRTDRPDLWTFAVDAELSAEAVRSAAELLAHARRQLCHDCRTATSVGQLGRAIRSRVVLLAGAAITSANVLPQLMVSTSLTAPLLRIAGALVSVAASVWLDRTLQHVHATIGRPTVDGVPVGRWDTQLLVAAGLLVLLSTAAIDLSVDPLAGAITAAGHGWLTLRLLRHSWQR